jgi:hypothetical protein
MRFLVVVALIVGACVIPASAQVSEKGVASITYPRKLTEQEKDAAIILAKQNSLERYFASESTSRQTLFERSKSSVLADPDAYITNWVVLSEQNDRSARRYEIILRADINETKLDMMLAQDSSTLSPAGEPRYVAVVFVARTPASMKVFDARRYERSDMKTNSELGGNSQQSGLESEDIRGSSISTTDEYTGSSVVSSSVSMTTETGGSTTYKADEITWQIAETSGIDQQITGILADRGVEVVPSEFIENLDLVSVKRDFGEGDDLAPETMRNLVTAVRANDIPTLLLGTLDTDLSDVDPVSGETRSHVTVNGRILDVTGKFPRVVSSIGPIQFSGIGPTETIAKTNAMKAAAEEVAVRMVDDYAVRGN